MEFGGEKALVLRQQRHTPTADVPPDLHGLRTERIMQIRPDQRSHVHETLFGKWVPTYNDRSAFSDTLWTSRLSPRIHRAAELCTRSSMSLERLE